jgi:hypothetical protein
MQVDFGEKRVVTGGDTVRVYLFGATALWRATRCDRVSSASRCHIRRETTPMMRQLKVADRIAFKVWRLSRGLQLGAAGLTVLTVALMVLYWNTWSSVMLWREWTLSLGQVALALVALIVTLAGLPVLRRLNVRKTLQQVAIGLGMATVGFAAARLHLHVLTGCSSGRGGCPGLATLARLLHRPPPGPGSWWATKAGRRQRRLCLPASPCRAKSLLRPEELRTNWNFWSTRFRNSWCSQKLTKCSEHTRGKPLICSGRF